MTLAIKIGITVSAILLWLFSQKLLGQRAHKPSKHGIGDFFHDLTGSWSRYLNKSPRVANGLLISSSLVIDALGIFLIAQSIFGESLRPLLALLILFTLRQVNQAITVLPTPEGMIWRHPGVPSIFVTYDVSNDLFFSGHTALAVLGALEIAQLGGPFFQALAAMIVIFEVSIVLLLRAHWTMDIFTGAITALWTYEIVGKFAPAVDQWIAKL